MFLSPRSRAWSKAARLMAQCLGYEAKQKMSLYKTSHTFNEQRNTHEIGFKLYIKHPVETSMHKPLVKEDVPKSDLTLLQELLAEIRRDAATTEAEDEKLWDEDETIDLTEQEWPEDEIIDLTSKGPTYEP